MQKLRWWFVHLAAFVISQTVLVAVGHSWPVAFVTQQVPDPLALSTDPAMWISRAWCVVFAIDTIWSLVTAFRGQDQHAPSQSGPRT